MKWHDVTRPLATGMAGWPGDPEVVVSPRASLAAGDACAVSELHLGSHSGTHVDAPSHFIAGGGTVDELPPEVLIGPCRVVDLTAVDIVRQRDLAGLRLTAGERLLIKTRNSERLAAGEARFAADYVALAFDAAAFLASGGVALVGIDALSIEPFASCDHRVHKVLLEKAVVILEGLNLAGIAPGEYQLLCLPLKVRAGDGAPARVLLGSGQDIPERGGNAPRCGE